MKENNKAQTTLYKSKNNYVSAEIVMNLNEENKKSYNESESEIKKDNENNGRKNDEKEKLIKIVDDISNRLHDENNKKKRLEEIYKAYDHKDEDKREIKSKNSYCFIYFFYFIFAAIMIIINLIGIFTIRAVMNSLYEVFTKSVQYYLWKKSDLEKNELTTLESIYNSPYNFYSQFFNDISNNEIDFDLMMFWDFFGSFLYDYTGFTCSSILFLLLNITILAFIGGFEFLDIYLFFYFIFIIKYYTSCFYWWF